MEIIQNMQNIKNVCNDTNYSLIPQDRCGYEVSGLTNNHSGNSVSFNNNDIVSVFAENPGGRKELRKSEEPKKKRKSPAYKSPKETPLYTLSYNILKNVDKIINNLSKDRKHTLGQKMLLLSLDMIKDVRMAWDYPEHRIGYLKDYLGNLTILEDLLQLCADESYIRQNAFLSLFYPVEKAEKQAQGWYASSINAGVCNGTPVTECANAPLKVDSDSPSYTELF